MEEYFIKKGYKCNLTHEYKPLAEYEEVPASKLYQVPVYKYAANLIKSNNIKNVLELGCGSGYKLVKYIYPSCQNIVGVDQQYAIDYCRNKYDVGEWNFENLDNEQLSNRGKFDMIICADVIEHLVDPDILLRKIFNFSHSKTHIIISTPERDKVRGSESMGPPDNLLHIREWNKDEFEKYLKNHGFAILNHEILNAKKLVGMNRLKRILNPKFDKTCQMVHCRINS